MEKVIVYGLGNNYKINKDYINHNYIVIGYCDKNENLKLDYKEAWIPLESISKRMAEDIDYLLVTFKTPLGIEDTEQLSMQLDVSLNCIKYLTHEMNRDLFDNYVSDSQVKTRKYLNDEQVECLNRIIEDDLFHREFRIVGGRAHSDKTFFIIRYGLDKVGLFTAYTVFAGHIKHALDKGYIPVIDMQNYPNIYLEPNEYGNKNAWELYFDQPGGFSVEEAYTGANIIMSDLTLIYKRPVMSEAFFYNLDGELKKWRRISHQYMRILPNLYSDIRRNYECLKGDSKVLGVYCRGTDYVKRQYPGHPVQPDPRNVLEDAKQIMREQGCEKIFVGTEDKDIAALFQYEFGNNYITNTREFVDYKNAGVGLTCTIQIERENDKYLQGREYLTTMTMCAMCDCILASRAGGSLGFFMLSDGWEYEKVYFLGEYPMREFKW